MRMISWGMAVAIAAGTVVGHPANAETEIDPPGACWSYQVKETVFSDDPKVPTDIGVFCRPLRGGVLDLVNGRPLDALGKFDAAERAATGILSPAMRALAEDEVRAARAIALEATDDVPQALQLMRRPGKAKRDVLALARAFLFARQEEYGEALQAFEAARRDLPAHWCKGIENAHSAIKARARGEAVDWPVEGSEHHLPSYLGLLVAGDCTSASWLGPMPTNRAFHAAFDLGQRTLGPTAQAALADMARYLKDQDEKFKGASWQWVLVGHADEACPKNRTIDCASYNKELSRERAEAVRARLLGLGVIDIPLSVRAMGMEAPVVPRGKGIAEAKNRRVQLVPQSTIAGGPTPKCPWEVTVFPGGLPDDIRRGGAATAASAVLAPESTLAVSRHASYRIKYVAPTSQQSRYFWAFTQTEAKAQQDIAALAGQADNDLKRLQAEGGHLARDLVFRVDPAAVEEEIFLHVADQPVTELEKLRQKPKAPANLGASMGLAPDERFTATVDGTPIGQADLPYLGRALKWEPYGSQPNYGDLKVVSARGNPLQSPAVASGVRVAAHVLSCSFKLRIN